MKARLNLYQAAAALLMAGALLAGPASPATGGDTGAQVKPVLAEKLPNVTGKSLTAIIVTFAPGGKSDKHHHAGSVFVYVLSGAIRSENSATGPVKVYKASESFFERPDRVDVLPRSGRHRDRVAGRSLRPSELLSVVDPTRSDDCPFYPEGLRDMGTERRLGAKQ